MANQQQISDTSHPGKAPKFKKESSAVDDLGTEYEVSMLTLLFMRGLNHSTGFHLACNHKDAHPFDDAVMEWRRPDGSTVLLMMQLKHKRDKKSVSRQELLTSAKKDLKEVWNHQKYGNLQGKVAEIWKEVGCSDIPNNVLFVLCKNVKLEERFTEDCSENLREIIGESGEIEQFLCNHQDVVEKFHNLDGDFLKQFSVLHNLTIEDVDKASRKEIEYAFCMPENLIEHIFEKVKGKIKSWWRRTGNLCYITEKWEKWSDVVENQVKSFNEMFTELHALRLRFSGDKVSALRRQLPDSGAVAVVSAPDESLFTTLKVRQALSDDKHLLVAKWPIPEEEWRRLVGLWRRSRWCHTLVLCVCGDDLPDKEIDQLRPAVSGDTFKRLIVVSERSPAEDWVTIDGHCSVSQLDEETQRRLKKTAVDFQGTQLTLGDLLEDQMDALQMGDAALIDACGDGVLEVGRRLPEIPHTFVDRTLFRSCHLRRDFFSSLSSGDVCVLIEATSCCQQEWLPHEHQMQKFGDFVQNAQGHSGGRESAWILLDDAESDNQFQYLCNNFKDTHFYWIESDKFGCKIRRTNFDVKHVRRFLIADRSTNYSIKEVIDGDRVTVLTGGPGMGKSTVTAWVAHEIKRRDPSVWVVVLNPAQCLSLTHHVQFDDKESVIRFLCATELYSDTENRYSASLLKCILQEKTKTAVLIDETDDLLDHQCEKFRSLIRILSSENNIQKLWVTSRGGLDVEELTGTPSFRIGEFTNKEKGMFFDSFMDHSYSTEIRDKFLSNSLFSTPLFANLCMEGITKNTDTGKHVGVFVRVSDQNILFENFIEIKLEAYFKNRLNLSVDNVKNILREAYYEHFTYEAVKLLLPRKQIKKINITDYKHVENLEDIGIITRGTNGIRGFVHRAFAEYFLARWMSKHVPKFQRVLTNIFQNKQLSLFRELLNRKLFQSFNLHEICANDAEEELKPFLQDDVTDLKRRDKGGRNLLHICSIFNSVRCAKHIIKHLKSLFDERDEVLGWAPLKYAVQFRSWGVADLFLEAGVPYDKFIKCVQEAQIRNDNLFAASCIEGHRNILKQLVSSKSITPAWRWAQLGPTALHLAVMNGHDTEFVRVLLPKAEINATDLDGQTALHMAAMRKDSDVVKLLTDHGAYVNVADNAGLTPLHCAALGGNEVAVGILLEKKADWSLNTRREENALHLSGSDSVVRALLVAGLGLEDRDWLCRTPLIHAASRRVPIVVKELLDAGADAEATDESGNTALHWALTGIEPFNTLCEILEQRPESDMKHVIQLLINKNTDINEINCSGESPLRWFEQQTPYSKTERYSFSTTYGLEGSKVLIKGAVAEVDAVNKSSLISLHAATHKLHTDVVQRPLHARSSDNETDELDNRSHLVFHLRRDLEDVYDLLNEGQDVIAVNSNGQLALHTASQLGHTEIVSRLLRANANVNAADKLGNRPLHLAAFGGHILVVDLLVNAGAHIDAVNSDRLTALHAAAQEGHANVIRRLHPVSASLSIAYELDNRLLYASAIGGHLDAVTVQYNAGADVDAVNKGPVALHASADEGETDSVRQPFRARANLDAADKLGNRPLHYAAFWDHLAAVGVLLNAGVKVDTVNNKGQTALHRASQKGHTHIVSWLLRARASVSVADNLGNRPLHDAALGGHLDAVDALVNAGADVDAVNNNGQVALHAAAQKGHADVVRRLLRAGANVNVIDILGNSPLHIAALGGHLDAVDVLVNAGAGVNAVNNNGYVALHTFAQKGHTDVVCRPIRAIVNAADNLGNRPLHIAALGGHLDAVDVLVNAGADVDAVNNDGQTALDLAAIKGHGDVVRCLHQRNAT